MSGADARLTDTKNDKQEKGLKMIKFALRRLDLRSQGAALVQWRNNISLENEMFWQESRSEEVRLRSLLRGLGEQTGAVVVRRIRRSWECMLVARMIWRQLACSFYHSESNGRIDP